MSSAEAVAATVSKATDKAAAILVLTIIDYFSLITKLKLCLFKREVLIIVL